MTQWYIYFGSAIEKRIETNFAANYTFLRRDCAASVANFLEGSNLDLQEDFLAIGVDLRFFEVKTFAPCLPQTLIVLSFWGDAYLYHYRHRASGRLFGFSLDTIDPAGVARRLETGLDADISPFLANIDFDEIGRRQAVEQLARGLADRFELIGEIAPEDCETALRKVVESTPSGARVAIIQPPLRARDDGRADPNPRLVALREVNERVAADFLFARIVDVEDVIKTPSEVGQFWHLDRIVYYRLFDQLQRKLRYTEQEPWPLCE